jgi:Protease II
MSNKPILMHMEMEAGHAGKTGRYQRLEEVARVYAFALKRLLWSA